MPAIAGRALAAYVVLLVLVRASGKRGIAQIAPVDFVTALILGDLVDDLLSAEVGLAQFAVAAATLVVAQTMVAAAQARWAKVHAWITGEPRVLLWRGRPDGDALGRERVREAELAAHLRMHGLERERWRDLRLVLLETRGAVTVKKIPRADNVERRDMAGTSGKP